MTNDRGRKRDQGTITSQAGKLTRAMIFAVTLAICGAVVEPQQAPSGQSFNGGDLLAGARQVFDGKLLPWVEVATFEHSDTLFPVNVVEHKEPVRPLAASAIHLRGLQFKSGNRDYDLFDYLAYDRVAGLLILKNGEVVLEDYELGTNAETRWPSFSMAKSVSSTLVAAAMQQGLINSLDDRMTQYLPEMMGGAYERVSIRDVLQMASGVKWDETYTDPKSDRRKLLEAQLAQKPGAIIAYMNALQRAGAPGSIWNYSTGDRSWSERFWNASHTSRWRPTSLKLFGSRWEWKKTRRGGRNLPAGWDSPGADLAQRCAITRASDRLF